jgi:hypothetical protein
MRQIYQELNRLENFDIPELYNLGHDNYKNQDYHSALYYLEEAERFIIHYEFKKNELSLMIQDAEKIISEKDMGMTKHITIHTEKTSYFPHDDLVFQIQFKPECNCYSHTVYHAGESLTTDFVIKLKQHDGDQISDVRAIADEPNWNVDGNGILTYDIVLKQSIHKDDGMYEPIGYYGLPAGMYFLEIVSDIDETVLSEKKFHIYSQQATELITTSDENMETSQITQETNSEGGGCLIATAAYGSEMAPQVQFLRELRDNTVLQTTSGTTFMNGFNQFYYSFSPQIADYERENPVFKEAVKVTLTPLLTSLTLLNYVDVDTEEEMLGYGIGIILLNVGMYFVAPAVLIIALKKRLDSFRGQ